MSRAEPGTRTDCGFTLIEVLIALAITSMVVSVLMSSVFYGIKVQSGIRQELTDREQILRSKAWFTEVLATCLPAEGGSGAELIGTAKEIVCDSMTPLRGQRTLAPQRVRLRLRVEAGQTAQLTYQPVGSNVTEQTVANLPTNKAEFSYVGSNGAEIAKWPTQFHSPETLPTRIRLLLAPDADSSTPAEWVVSLRATPWLDPIGKLPAGFGLVK